MFEFPFPNPKALSPSEPLPPSLKEKKNPQKEKKNPREKWDAIPLTVTGDVFPLALGGKVFLWRNLADSSLWKYPARAKVRDRVFPFRGLRLDGPVRGFVSSHRVFL